MGVPKVSKEVREALIATLKSAHTAENKTDLQYMLDTMENMRLENPELYNVVNNGMHFQIDAGNIMGATAIAKIATLLYGLIGNQIEANEMNELWGEK